MRRFGLPILAVMLVACAACSSDNSNPSDVPVERIVGNERIGWDQSAQTLADLDKLTYQISVDDVPSDLVDVKCTPPAGPQGFACTGKLPTMTPGPHGLRIASISKSNGRRSDWSSPIPVVAAGSSSSSLAPSSDGRTFTRTLTTVDRVKVKLTTVAEGLNDATDLASLPDGRTLVAERSGGIREVRVDGTDPQIRSLTTVSDVRLGHQGGLLSLTADPAFDSNGYVYAVYTAADGFRVVRFRDTGERLEERVTLLDKVQQSDATPAAAVIRFGPDDKLYVAFDDAGDARRAGDLGSYNGKVLRLNADATTPSDQPAGTPVFVLDVNAPYGLAWTSAAGPLWIVQAGPDAKSGEVRAIVRDGTGQRGRVAVRYLLPAGSEPSRMAVYQGDRMAAFKGDLFVATGPAGGVLRIKLDRADPLKIVSTERLLDDGKTVVRGVSVARDGSMYLLTATSLMRMMDAE